ncbi:NAD(P)-dependent dehydrogenase (short-subunit alcohol dehydrogenase family) [Bradyrhizobium sp. USDA 4448]
MRLQPAERNGACIDTCDLAVTHAVPVFAKSIRDEFGAIYGLFKNARIRPKYVARHMMAVGAGRIVKFPLFFASTGYSGLSVYAASKARSLVSPAHWPEKSAESASP